MINKAKLIFGIILLINIQHSAAALSTNLKRISSAIKIILTRKIGTISQTSNYFKIPNFSFSPYLHERQKTCLVTGASYGLGEEISRRMIKKGWKVIGIARSENRLKELSSQLGPEFSYYVCDVSKFDQIYEVSESIKKQKIDPSIFFLNAGIGIKEIPYKFSVQNNVDMFNTNYFGTITWIEQWLNTLRNNGGGTFVAISSVSTFFPMGSASYSASKAAINTCFRGLQLQYSKDNINFIPIIQGPIKTRMCKRTLHVHEPADDAKYIIDKVFIHKKQIETNLYYSTILKLINYLPTWLALKIKIY